MQHHLPSKAASITLTAWLALAATLSAQPVRAQTNVSNGHFVTSDGVELHYLEAGSGPLLVLVPGWTMPAWIWQPQIDYFSSSYHVVALDPRGQGESEKAPYGYFATRQGQDICELLAHLDDNSAVIVGWSIAGQHVLMCADEVGPDVVRAVVVVDWDVILEPSFEFAKNRISLIQEDRENFTREFVEAIHVHPDSAYVEALVDAVLQVPDNAAAMSTANWYFFGPHDMSPIIDRLDRPLLLIFSALDWALEAADETRMRWPDTPVELVEGTSHALFADRPHEFNRILDDFLTSLPTE